MNLIKLRDGNTGAVRPLRKEDEKMRLTLEQAIDRAFDKCNLMDEDCDIYCVIYKYKVIREQSDEVIDEIYEDIAYRLGYMR